MAKIDTTDHEGGPAFPTTNVGWPGMSLRDWFAGRALSALATEALRLDHKLWGATARHAYIIADAMLAERARRRRA
jgi:hypothetical protein